MIVRMAGMADVAALADLRGIEPDKLAAYADWVAAHAETHLPFVAEVDGHVVGAAWLLVAERVPGHNDHREALMLWESGSYSDKNGPQDLSHEITSPGQAPS